MPGKKPKWPVEYGLKLKIIGEPGFGGTEMAPKKEKVPGLKHQLLLHQLLLHQLHSGWHLDELDLGEVSSPIAYLQGYGSVASSLYQVFSDIS